MAVYLIKSAGDRWTAALAAALAVMATDIHLTVLLPASSLCLSASFACHNEPSPHHSLASLPPALHHFRGNGDTTSAQHLT